MDRGARWGTVHWVAKSRIQLDIHFHFLFFHFLHISVVCNGHGQFVFPEPTLNIQMQFREHTNLH